jgi:anthraniloyl-CoA monooxygenase
VRISVLGAGPAGLYLALLVKRANADHDVEVIERNPPDATYGWGVVFSDRTLGSFRDADHRSFVRITDDLVVWDAIDIRHRGERVRCGGQTFSGISRMRLLRILQERCAEVGVRLAFREEVDELDRFADADLVVAADGVNSLARRVHQETFRPRIVEGRSRYVWFGTTLPLEAFTFIFREHEHGLFQVHAYPFDGGTSTFIVECDEGTWRRAGLDRATEEDSVAFCEGLFAEDLGGHRLLSNRSQWLSFPTVRCRSWRQGRLVLAGDAAHTAHFSIGSGTKLAMEDAIALADALARHDDLDAATARYEAERRPVVERFQQAALESQRYFEHTSRVIHLEPLQFASHLLTRSGRIGYADLRVRDPAFVASVDAWFAGTAAGAKVLPSVAPSAALVPLQLRGVRLPNRTVVEPTTQGAAREGVPAEPHRGALTAAVASGAGLVLIGPVAVAPEGRTTPGTAGLWTDEQGEAWAGALRAAERPAVGIRLHHAGRRASTRPRDHGADRSLTEGGWPALAPSPIPYGPGLPVPVATGPEDLDRVREAYAAAARRAAAAGFDLLLLDMARGHLLASFLSPLSNHRDDSYGGSLDRRMAFPLEVLESVRAAWPDDRPVAVALTAVDGARGGAGLDEAVTVTRALVGRGCDLVEVLAGQTTLGAMPGYDPSTLVSFSDRVRNEVRVPTLAFGPITSIDQISTVVASGRADLCHLLTP